MRAFLGMILVGAAALSACGGGGPQSGPPPPPPAQAMLSLLAGGPGGPGSQDGAGPAASFGEPTSVATDSAGNVYVADEGNETIRKITPAGVVSTFAGTAGQTGSTDGTGAAARFTNPWGVATDSAGNVYVADAFNFTIRKITPNGAVSTLAGTAGTSGSTDGTGAAARFGGPWSVATDAAGNVYVADSGNNTIRKITPDGAVSTFAGTAGTYGSTDGMGAAARFNTPRGVATDSAGNVYVGDSMNDTIRKISPDGLVTTLAGTAGVTGSADGSGPDARFKEPAGVATDGAGNVYVADDADPTVRKITPTGVVTTLAGIAPVTGSADRTGAAASFDRPSGVTTDGAGNVYVADSFYLFSNTSPPATGNNIIRKITPDGVVTTLAGSAGVTGSTDGTGAAARFNVPLDVAADGAGNVYVADSYNHTIRKITPGAVVTTLAGTAGAFGSTDGTGAAVRFNTPEGVATDGAGNVYVADSGNGTIRSITPEGVVTTVAGTAGVTGSADGTGAAASFYYPLGLATDGAGNVYVADTNNDTIRKVTQSGVVTTLAGMAGVTGSTDGTGSAARFDHPSGVALDGGGNVYVADTGNDIIRKITPSGVVTTIVGLPGQHGFVPGPLPGLLETPRSVTLFGTTLYTTTNNAIVQVSNVR